MPYIAHAYAPRARCVGAASGALRTGARRARARHAAGVCRRPEEGGDPCWSRVPGEAMPDTTGRERDVSKRCALLLQSWLRNLLPARPRLTFGVLFVQEPRWSMHSIAGTRKALRLRTYTHTQAGGCGKQQQGIQTGRGGRAYPARSQPAVETLSQPPSPAPAYHMIFQSSGLPLTHAERSHGL